MPHIHQRSNNSFRFAISLWVCWLGEFLVNSVLKTGKTKGVMWRAFVFCTVVGIHAFNQVWTRLNHIFQQEFRSTIRCFVRHNRSVEF